MLKIFFKYTLLVTVIVFYSACGINSEDPIVNPLSKEFVNSIKKVPKEEPLFDSQLAGKEHNQALSYLVNYFESKERPTYDEIFEVWIDYANCRMVELGYPKISEEDTKMYYDNLKLLNSYCQTQFAGDAIISYIKYLDASGLISQDFTEYSLNTFSDIDFEKNDPNQVKECMMKRVSYLDKEDQIMAQSMISIAEYSNLYWNEYFISRDPKNDKINWKKYDSEEKETKASQEEKRKNENVRDLCVVLVDAAAGAGVASTGAGTFAVTVVGAVGSFLFKEAMGW